MTYEFRKAAYAAIDQATAADLPGHAPIEVAVPGGLRFKYKLRDLRRELARDRKERRQRARA